MAEHKPAPKTMLNRFLVCLFYGLTSGSLSLLMKKLLSRYGFSGFFLLLAAQMGLQLGLCILSRDRMGNPFGVPDYDRATHMTSLRLGVTGVGNVAVGMLGLQVRAGGPGGGGAGWRSRGLVAAARPAQQECAHAFSHHTRAPTLHLARSW